LFEQNTTSGADNKRCLW